VLEVGREALIIVSPIGGVMMRRCLEERERIEVSKGLAMISSPAFLTILLAGSLLLMGRANACPTLP
jgi:hypothetical protein